MEPSPAARTLVEHLVAQCRPGAELVQFVADLPDHYTLRVDVSGEIGKTLILSRHLVDGALTKPAARRSLELYLRFEVLRQRAQQPSDRPL